MTLGQRTVSHCTLICPGLLGPVVPLEELPAKAWPARSELPCLSRLLRDGKICSHSRQSLEYQILSQLGLAVTPDAELPVACLRNRAAAENATTRLWCLDPVHVQIDREMAYLSPPSSMMLTESEAQELIASLNTHFGDELHVHYHSPEEWLVELSMELSTTTPVQAVGQDMQRVQATGKDDGRWRSVLNEIQMLLHSHPVNQVRETKGEPLVNSLWLWGGGETAVVTTSITAIYANDTLSASAAAYAEIPYQKLPPAISPEKMADQTSLMVLSFLMDAVRRKDAFAWIAGLRVLEQNYLTPLEAMLRQGRIAELKLVSDTVELTLNKIGVGKWWQRSRSLSSVIPELRNRYGY